MENLDLEERITRRVRLDLDNTLADKLKYYAQRKGRSQASVVEFLIKKLPDPLDSL